MERFLLRKCFFVIAFSLKIFIYTQLEFIIFRGNITYSQVQRKETDSEQKMSRYDTKNASNECEWNFSAWEHIKNKLQYRLSFAASKSSVKSSALKPDATEDDFDIIVQHFCVYPGLAKAPNIQMYEYKTRMKSIMKNRQDIKQSSKLIDMNNFFV